MEKTFVCVKPDGVQRGLIGEVVKRFESRGLVLCAAKFMQVSKELAAKHYAEHEGKPFYEGLISYITSGPVFAMVWAGDDVVKAVRQTVGATRPTEAAPGTIRYDFAAKMDRNLIHASDAVATAEREIALWFKPEEIVDWDKVTVEWVFGKNS
ncbi:MAG: nucleoside-diphosphate kinase [Anaerolineaceae bacterium]|nr:nucleoside-diphosphate kinase [Anaerolineaceae bacterium]